MLENKIGYREYIFVLLYSVLPFTLSDSFYNSEDSSVYLLPANMVWWLSMIRWILICFMILSSLVLLVTKRGRWNKFYAPVFAISMCYLILLVYSIADFIDVSKYFLLVLMSFSIPIYISNIRISNDLLVKLKIIILAVLLISVIPNINTLFVGRFSGFSGNANSFGALGVCFISLLLVRTNTKYEYLFVLGCIMTFILVLLSGSRNSVFGSIILLIFNYKLTAKRIVLLFLIFFILALSLADNESFLRIFDSSTSVLASGRGEIWESAISFIRGENFVFGNGVLANKDLVGVANIHNVYIRLLLNMGVIFTVVALMFYFLGLLFLAKYWALIPRSLLLFNVVFLMMNLGEDYLIGPGSIILTYAFINIGISLNFVKNENTTNKYGL